MKEHIATLHGIKINSIYSAEYFRNSLAEAISERKFDGLQIDIFSVDFYKNIVASGGYLILSEDNLFGIYVSHDGEMGSLFKSRKSRTIEAAPCLLNLAVKYGGRYFNAYGTHHLEQLYVNNNFNPVARMKFEVSIAPKGWENSSLANKPDVVFFAYSPNGIYNVGGGMYFYDWDEANNYAKAISKNLTLSHERSF